MSSNNSKYTPEIWGQSAKYIHRNISLYLFSVFSPKLTQATKIVNLNR